MKMQQQLARSTAISLNLTRQRKYATYSMDGKLHFADKEGHTTPFPDNLRR